MAREPWIVPQREAEFAERADGELEALSLADEVSRLLAEIIQNITIDATKDERDADELRRHALWFMAIITFRSLREPRCTCSRSGTRIKQSASTG